LKRFRWLCGALEYDEIMDKALEVLSEKIREYDAQRAQN